MYSINVTKSRTVDNNDNHFLKQMNPGVKIFLWSIFKEISDGGLRRVLPRHGPVSDWWRRVYRATRAKRGRGRRRNSNAAPWETQAGPEPPTALLQAGLLGFGL